MWFTHHLLVLQELEQALLLHTGVGSRSHCERLKQEDPERPASRGKWSGGVSYASRVVSVCESGWRCITSWRRGSSWREHLSPGNNFGVENVKYIL